jgi:hypothetical protein
VTGVALLAVVGAKGAPGATTSVVALACGWPRSVVLADVDLAGGDVAAGWLGSRVGLDRGLLSFAAATRHADTAAAADLVPHLAAVPEAPQVFVLPGLAHAGQASGLDDRLWSRLVAAAAGRWPHPDPDAGTPAAPAPVDLLADCGRISAATPWPLLASASVVLVATRPTLRGVHHARHARAALQAAAPTTAPATGRATAQDVDRVGLLVCGPGPYHPAEVGRAVGLPVRVVLPADPRAGEVLADGVPAGRGWSRTVLARAARTAARQLAAVPARPSAAEAPRPAVMAPAAVASAAVAEQRTAAGAGPQQPTAAQRSAADGGRR